jgi:pyruvate,water dikinase
MRRVLRQLRSLVRRWRRIRTPEEFERLFERFRAVMDANTHALEIITDMGDVLGGDYLFDIQYVRRSYDELGGHLARSLDQFAALTDDRYPDLPEVYARIDGEIRRVMDGQGESGGPLVREMPVVTDAHLRSAGAKMTNLAVAARSCSLPVPDGFVVTMEGYREYLRHNRVLERFPLPVEGTAPDRSWYRNVSEAVLNGEMPPELRKEIAQALRSLRARAGTDRFLAVRSSAAEEDSDRSFAGQYRTVLNVGLEEISVGRAYREVIASLFSERAAAYQQRFGYDPGSIAMAVGVLEMVDAVASGVLYTADPSGTEDRMIITAAWGLGTSVVDGTVDADQFFVSADGAIIERRVGSKARMSVRLPDGGIEETFVPDDKRGRPSLSEAQVSALVFAGACLERQFRSPQDVEWAIDGGGRLVILQSRPLGMPDRDTAMTEGLAQGEGMERVIFQAPGTVVQRGTAAGPVRIVRSSAALDSVPRGSVLVVKHDAPDLVRAMPFIAAIITDTGSLASHMASLAREFRIPTVVNTGDATRVLAEGQPVTVVLAEEAVVYDGAAAAFVPSRRRSDVDDLYEFRRKRYLLRFIAPLNLVDPFRDDFSPSGCRTLHDMLRFVHERSVGRLIEAAGFGARSGGAVKLDLPVPAGITVIDIGGGLRPGHDGRTVRPEQVASEPLAAIIEGVVEPGLWRSDAVPLSVNDFLTSMFRAPDLLAESDRQTGTNVAVVSREYLNLNIKFGYHYTIVDSYLSDTPRSNHIYFRFAGGATDMTKRSRRLLVIAKVLEEQGYALSTKGDMLIARVSNLPREEMQVLLRMVGRLLAYTRQLDAVLRTDEDVALHAGNLMQVPAPDRSGGKG